MSLWKKKSHVKWGKLFSNINCSKFGSTGGRKQLLGWGPAESPPKKHPQQNRTSSFSSQMCYAKCHFGESSNCTSPLHHFATSPLRTTAAFHTCIRSTSFFKNCTAFSTFWLVVKSRDRSRILRLRSMLGEARVRNKSVRSSHKMSGNLQQGWTMWKICKRQLKIGFHHYFKVA